MASQPLMDTQESGGLSDGSGSSEETPMLKVWSNGPVEDPAPFEVDDCDERQPLQPRKVSIGWVDVEEAESRTAPKGPYTFLEAVWFQAFLSGLLVTNGLVLVCTTWPHFGDLRLSLHLFLALYVAEIALRAADVVEVGGVVGVISLQPANIVNWIDFVAVAGSVVFEWILPLCGHDGAGRGWILICLRATRVLWMLLCYMATLRQVKLARARFKGDLNWVESSWWHSRVGYVIIINAVVMGFETDIQSPLFTWLEQFFLLFFIVELVCRLRLRGRSFFTDPEDRTWNILDIIIVMCGVCDQWLLEAWRFLLQKQGGTFGGQMMGLVRILRLMRILRLVRVAKSMRPLRLLAIGVVRAMQSMFWVLVLTFVLLYLLGILTTRMIGKGEHSHDIPAETVSMFETIPDSMFTLFAFMNGHDWHKVAPLLDLMPLTKPFFVIFTIYSSWALLSVMTGVVSDHISYVRLEQQRQDDEEAEERREQLKLTLTQIFAAADYSGTGTLSRTAYMEVCDNAYQMRRLQRAIHQPVDNLRQIFDWLDIDRRGILEFDEFCDGLQCLEDMVTGQRLLKMDSAVKLMCSACQQGVDSIGGSMEELRTECADLHEELIQRMDAALQRPGEAPLDLQSFRHSGQQATSFGDISPNSAGMISGGDEGGSPMNTQASRGVLGSRSSPRGSMWGSRSSPRSKNATPPGGGRHRSSVR